MQNAGRPFCGLADLSCGFVVGVADEGGQMSLCRVRTVLAMKPASGSFRLSRGSHPMMPDEFSYFS
jgi:hypothetical protein